MRQSTNNNQPTTKTQKKATSMADLMKSAKTPFVTLKKGEQIQGIVTKLDPRGVLVDIGAKAEAIVMEKDRRLLRNLLNTLHVGDTVTVTVLYPESENGSPVVSLRRFTEQLSWEKLSKAKMEKQAVSVLVEDETRGGYMVSTGDGIAGFLPHSHTLPHAGQIVGKNVNLYVLEMNREGRKAVFSQKPILDETDFTALVSEIKVGQKITSVVTGITSFGVFTTIQVKEGTYVDGLMHISEVSWDEVRDLSSLFKTGESIECMVIGIDTKMKRVELSQKKLTTDPFEQKAATFTLEQKVSGVVESIGPQGIVVDLDGTAGFIRREKIPPTVTYEEGEPISATVTEIDRRRRRIVLTPVLKEKPIGYR